MSTARFIVGDTREVVASLPDASVDLVLTSPPFLALRSYLPADHPDKGSEIGSEGTPAAFLAVLLDLAQGWRRVLAPHGSICVELGDTYAGNIPPFGATADQYSRDARGTAPLPRKGAGWPLDKSLCMIPQLFAASLSYGRNLLEPTQTFEPWRVRNVVRWVRPNPPVGALGDKFRPATSEMTVACMSRSRWFDLDAVRTPHDAETGANSISHSGSMNPAGAPPLDWWEIPTHGYPGAHYATWPPALCVKPIKAMCPERVCRVCGEPSRRIVENPNAGHGANAWNRHGTAAAVFHKDIERPHHSERIHLGWTGCACLCEECPVCEADPIGDPCTGKWRPGVVLDPFGGSGTTGMVATGLGRDAILIDIDARNLDLARDRIGLFLEAS